MFLHLTENIVDTVVFLLHLFSYMITSLASIGRLQFTLCIEVLLVELGLVGTIHFAQVWPMSLAPEYKETPSNFQVSC